MCACMFCLGDLWIWAKLPALPKARFSRPQRIAPSPCPFLLDFWASWCPPSQMQRTWRGPQFDGRCPQCKPVRLILPSLTHVASMCQAHLSIFPSSQLAAGKRMSVPGTCPAQGAGQAGTSIGMERLRRMQHSRSAGGLRRGVFLLLLSARFAMVGDASGAVGAAQRPWSGQAGREGGWQSGARSDARCDHGSCKAAGGDIDSPDGLDSSVFLEPSSHLARSLTSKSHKVRVLIDGRLCLELLQIACGMVRHSDQTPPMKTHFEPPKACREERATDFLAGL